jgi:hypothetical protein
MLTRRRFENSDDGLIGTVTPSLDRRRSVTDHGRHRREMFRTSVVGDTPATASSRRPWRDHVMSPRRPAAAARSEASAASATRPRS